MGLNTTTSIKKTSSVLGKKCEDTIANMSKLMKDLGVTDYKSTKTLIPRIRGSEDDVLFVGINGVRFYFKRGATVNLPDPVLEVLKNTGEL